MSLLHFTFRALLILTVLTVMCSCNNAPRDLKEKETKKRFPGYPVADLAVKTSSVYAWKGNAILNVAARTENMNLIFEVHPGRIRKELNAFSHKNNHTSFYFNFEVLVNGQPIRGELAEIKDSRMSGERYSCLDDASGIFSLKSELRDSLPVRIFIPVYALRRFKAGTNLNFSVRVWQDYFLCEKQREPDPANGSTYYTDTLHKKLIDNAYSFIFKMPEIIKTDIICDSIILQNDKEWSPAGSDNTIFKSSYPDIYYSVYDYSVYEQASSHIEKSSASFIYGDTVTLYRYKTHEPFYLQVFDHDNLSCDDLIGWMEMDPDTFNDNQLYILKAGYAQRIYFKKKNYGKIN